ncbi:hypothetical protein PVAND_002431 [Polypedilum vanderplanki]|uniref:Mitochondria-eating protein n=1 Tax=Polypedilum vanderplanki TaxID=319348 RepID=A0A9J6BSH4_POLVA|nr:hypothetical protein PVAND_002431 [Polypedilum vanderplanki]
MNSRERIRICSNKQERGGSLNAHQVIRRLLVLCEGRQYVEAQHLINRLSPSALCLIACEMPLDLLAEALPYSSTLLETLFGRLNTLIHSANSKPNVNVDCIIWHLVKLFGSPCEYNLIRKCEKLAFSIGLWIPKVKCELKEKENLMECAIQGLGNHGLTHETDENGNFISLQSAIKSSLQLHIETYRHAITIIDESDNNNHNDPAQSSHQRLLSLKYDDIQKRLISNKTLLTKLEVPSLKQLSVLIEKLSERVENDKKALICLNLIKKFDRDVNFKECSAAKIIMDMRKGLTTVQSLMNPQNQSHNIVVNNGNINFNEDSSSSAVSFKSDSHSESDGYHSDHSIESDEQKLLIEEYSLIYKTMRLDTLKLLTKSNNFHIAESVKLKILFSIVVLAFRSCHNLRERKLLEAKRVLCTQANGERHKEQINALENSIKNYLLATCDAFCLDEVENSIATQIYTSLHGYSCINQLLDTLSKYIEKIARLAWKLTNQTPPYFLDVDFTLSTINQKKHVRTSKSNPNSAIIEQFLWPALFQENKCVAKAIVVT